MFTKTRWCAVHRAQLVNAGQVAPLWQQTLSRWLCARNPGKLGPWLQPMTREVRQWVETSPVKGRTLGHSEPSLLFYEWSSKSHLATPSSVLGAGMW